MVKNQFVCDEINNIYKKIGNIYLNKNENIPPSLSHIPDYCLQGAIQQAFIYSEDILATKKEIYNILENSDYVDEILDVVNVEKAYLVATIRRDWSNALKATNNIYCLAADIGWGFSKKDISELAKLHKANRYRKKIEALLDDCNFHKECNDFTNGNYNKYIA